jgi:hypothetical protein
VTASSSSAAKNQRLDEELELTFPASDPPSITQPVAHHATGTRTRRGPREVVIAALMFAGAILVWRSFRA